MEPYRKDPEQTRLPFNFQAYLKSSIINYVDLVSMKKGSGAVAPAVPAGT